MTIFDVNLNVTFVIFCLTGKIYFFKARTICFGKTWPGILYLGGPATRAGEAGAGLGRVTGGVGAGVGAAAHRGHHAGTPSCTHTIPHSTFTLFSN